MKLEIGKIYKLNYSESEPIARTQWGSVAMIRSVDLSGKYEYIGMYGNNRHFYNSDIGKDIYLTKEETLKALDNEDK